MEIGKTEIEFLGLKIKKGQVVLQEHILKIFKRFPDFITHKAQLQRFLGSLHYTRPFQKGQAKDIHTLEKRLKKNPPQWNQQMTEAIKRIKGKVQELPSLTLPIGEGQLILETNASDKAWGVVLLEKEDNKENIALMPLVHSMVQN